MTDHRRNAIEVTAFNDVAVHWLVKPRTMEEIRAELRHMLWTSSKTDWNEVHREYVDRFAAELADPDTLNWREQRSARIRKAAQRPVDARPNRRRRA